MNFSMFTFCLFCSLVLCCSTIHQKATNLPSITQRTEGDSVISKDRIVEELKSLSAVEEEEEYKVYSLVINEYLKKSKASLAVISQITSGAGLTPVQNRDNTLDHLFPATRADQKEIKSFKQKNLLKYRLLEKFNLSKEYKLVLGQLEQIDKDIKTGNDGWGNFYKRYPNSQGVFTLSRVGFNENKTQAIVYRANQFSADGGGGVLIFLSKWEGRWQIVNEEVLWVI
jgi:hypothetical protein